MIARFKQFVGAAAGLGFAFGAAAGAAPLTSTAPIALVMDAGTGDVLFDHNGDQLFDPSSMAKLMTLEVVFDAMKSGRLKPTETFRVSKHAWKMPSPKMFTRAGADIPVEALIQGITVDSGNDASVVIAEGLAPSEEAFAAIMTKHARAIGLTKSTFVNATGLADPGEQMTAREIALLAQHLMTAYPGYYHYFGQHDFTWEKINQTNRLVYLGMGSDIDGLKAGHVDGGDYGVVVSAARDTRRFIVVVNGLSSDKDSVAEAKRLLSAAFHEYRAFELIAANQIVGTIPVFGGQSKDVGLTVDQPVERLMSHDMRAKMKVSLDYDAPIKAPVKAGTKVGTLTVTVPGTDPTVVPVMTIDNVARIGTIGMMKIGLAHLFFGEMGDLPPPSTVRHKHGSGAGAGKS